MKSRYQLVITSTGRKIGGRIVGARARVIDASTGQTVAASCAKADAAGLLRSLRRSERQMAGGAA